MKLKLTQEQQSCIEEITRGQDTNPHWKQYRKGVITGSVVHDVSTRMKSINNGRATDAIRLVQQCLNLQPFKGKRSTRYGHANEDRAAQEYNRLVSNNHVNFRLFNLGLIMSKDGYMGASVDRMATCDCHDARIVEVKCPSSLEKQGEGSISKLGYVNASDEPQPSITLKQAHRYYSQVQWYMGLTGKQMCDFVIWSPQEMKVIPLSFDLAHWQVLFNSSISFFKKFLAPALLQPRDSAVGNIGNIEQAKFVENHVCAICSELLPESDDMDDDTNASVQCDCQCKCLKWFHWRCVSFVHDTSKDWYCPEC